MITFLQAVDLGRIVLDGNCALGCGNGTDCV
jgi:hypothetical protein